MASNPFHDLYLSEAISEDQLVEIFSPVIVKHSAAVFESGNVIVRGLQGTGKTMLLNLLRPESRLAYWRARKSFPVSQTAARFVGAGVNLRKCGALEFAQHLEPQMDSRSVQDLALLFADFVNYWVVADLMASISCLMSSGDQALLKDIGLSDSAGRLQAFAAQFGRDPCWFGALDNTESFQQLIDALNARIKEYRRFLNLNVDTLPESIKTTKTVIGDPILKAVEALRSTGVLSDVTKVFVRIDQYEQLETLNVVGTEYGTACQQLINKALAARDSRVSYRVATRTHSWQDRPAIYRTHDVLERKRDYDIVDMDQLFRRRENSRTWLFPEFAEDIFRRRMRVSDFATGTGTDLSIASVLGRGMTPSARASSYVPTSTGRRDVIARAVGPLVANQLPEAWAEYIVGRAPDDILSAWLTTAWVRQKLATRQGVDKLGPAPKSETLPWTDKPYWYKERVPHALMQIASANRQALIWSGVDDVITLGGGQILVFLFILQHIWDAWLRDQRGERAGQVNLPISHQVQSQGVLEASIEWRQKQAEGIDGHRRKSFVDAIGHHFFVELLEDKAMSYPGANGFSVENSDLEHNPDVQRFLVEAASFGDLYDSPHTSKKKGERRTKYYLAPILSPYFRIHSVHTKEPLYVTSAQVRKWMAIDTGSQRSDEPKASQQPTLWDSLP